MSTTEEVCHDFEKGNCMRGDKCKYTHKKMEVCRDFQSKKCERERCRFLHVTQEEEVVYENTGTLPDHISKGNKRPSSMGGGQDFGAKRHHSDSLNLLAGLSAITNTFAQNNVMSPDQLCRDFEKGNCTRGNRCKYYHPKLKICRDFQNNKCERESCRFLHMTREEEESYESSGILPDHIDEGEAKRMKVMNGSSGRRSEDTGGQFGKRRREDNFDLVAGLAALPQVILEENELLKQKVTELQRQITDLHKMNDTLFEQNNSYRTTFREATKDM